MSIPRLAASSGTFEKYPFWQILCDAHFTKFSGTLALIHPQKKKSLMFEQGKIVGTRSSLGEEATIQTLIDSKKITLADIRPVMPSLEGKESIAQLDVLVKQGRIEPAQVQSILDYQTLIRVSEVFQWKEGRFAFVAQLPQDMIRVPHSQETCEMAMAIVFKQIKPGTFEVSTLDIETNEYAFLLEHIKSIPAKFLSMVQNALRTQDATAFQRELQSLAANDVKTYLAFLGELKVIRIKKTFAPESSTQAKAAQTTHSVKELNDRIKSFGEMDYYTLFQVKRNAKEDEIKQKFLVLAKQYHPDQLQEDVTLEIKKLVSHVFSIISQAHAHLVDPKRREEYDAQLELKESGFDSGQAERILEAEMVYMRAEALVKKGDFALANSELEKVLALNDKEADYHLLYGWSLFKEGSAKKNTIQVKRGRDQITRAITMKPQLFMAYYYLGLIAKIEENITLAKDMFQKCLNLNPTHQESNSELRVINMREQKGTGLKNFLQKKK